uniref:Mitochondrial pyruvate carrier n=1 Tax=Blastobotrys adeninivorans TaxID=409370 RepID=A0A060T840_BLAAD
MSSGSAFKRATDFLFSKEAIKYVCSTHFWGPVSNFGIPFAAVMDLKKDPELISGPMTGSLVVYSLVFMRYATAVTPWNPLLFGCHFVNECAQLGQGARWVNYWYFGGREKSLQEKAAAPAAPADKN